MWPVRPNPLEPMSEQERRDWAVVMWLLVTPAIGLAVFLTAALLAEIVR